MQAIILVGGLGTRLRTVLPDLPKPMAPIQDKPFLAYLLDYLCASGFKEIIFAVHYKHEIIQDYFQEKYLSLKIKYVIEDELRGTGGALLHVFNQIDVQDNIFVLNGDTFVKLDYRAMYLQHLSKNAALTIALSHMSDCKRYGSVATKDNYIVGFNEKGVQSSGFINAGVYLIQPNIFKSYKLPDKFSFEIDFLSLYLQQLKPHAFITDSHFIDIGIPEDYARAQTHLPQWIAV